MVLLCLSLILIEMPVANMGNKWLFGNTTEIQRSAFCVQRFALCLGRLAFFAKLTRFCVQRFAFSVLRCVSGDWRSLPS